jgi:cytoplasmic iron level regulating protein YaaA (DUF328/UPF0246 family)
VLVLLPPSEAKATGGEGPPVGRRPVLSTPELAAPRAALLAAVRRAARADRSGLAAGLHLPPSAVAAALAATTGAGSAPTRAALDRYTGVVYQAIDVAGLTAAARRRAERTVVVTSGLWGVVRGGDLVPDYRVPAAATVPGHGRVTAHWRRPLAVAMPRLVGDQPVLDLRSTDYRGMWRPSPGLRDQVVAVRVLAERPTGAVAPVSYHAKWVKGLVVGHLVRSRRTYPDPMTALADAADALELRLVDTSTATDRSVDLVGRYAGPAGAGSPTR